MTRSGAMALILGVIPLIWTSGVYAAEKVPVFVSILPQKYFVEKIGGRLVTVSVMVKPGASPATYEPKPRQMARLSKTKIYYAIGVPFEKAWLKKIASANPGMMVVHTDKDIKKIPMKTQHYHKNKRQHKKEHHHGGEILDPHIWLSPPLVKDQAQHIFQALVSIDPAHRSAYDANYNNFIKELDVVDAELKNILAGKKNLQFMVSHPSWGYFAHTYGLEQVPIEIEGKEPKPAQLKDLIRHANEHGIKVIFVQPQFSAKSAELVAKEIGGQVAFVDPLAGNWFDNLREVAGKFKAALR